MNNSSSVLILRLSALGDILHTLPAVIALRDAMPDRRFVWVVEAPYAEMTRMIAPVDEVIPLATKRWRRSLGKGDTWRELQRSVRQIRHLAMRGASIDFQGLVKSAVIGAAAGCRVRYGFASSAIRERGALVFLNHRVQVDVSRHVIEQNLQLARGAGASAGVPPPVSLGAFPNDPEGKLKGLLSSPPIILNPGAGRADKLWGAGRFAELAKQIESRWKVRPLVVWGPGEREMADEIVAGSPAALAPQTSLRELALLLQHARVVVAGDTGPLHLAAAAATPVVGLFGPTSPWRNGPWGQLDRVVESFSSSKKMEDVTVSGVMDRLGEILG